MGYITLFQFLRRCLLLDAEAYPPPREILRETRRRLYERGTGEIARIGPAEQVEQPGDESPTGTDGGGENRSPPQKEEKERSEHRGHQAGCAGPLEHQHE